jgi:cytochrome P450
VEALLHAELACVLGGRLPAANDFENLAYTRQVVAESLRLYPPIWVIVRQALCEYAVGGYVIPKGATLLISQWVMQHDPRYFPQPWRFDPQRWTPENQASRPLFAYFPFGGAGVCTGEGFAWMALTLALATIAQNWQTRLVAGRPLNSSRACPLLKMGCVVFTNAHE